MIVVWSLRNLVVGYEVLEFKYQYFLTKASACNSMKMKLSKCMTFSNGFLIIYNTLIEISFICLLLSFHSKFHTVIQPGSECRSYKNNDFCFCPHKQQREQALSQCVIPFNNLAMTFCSCLI